MKTHIQVAPGPTRIFPLQVTRVPRHEIPKIQSATVGDETYNLGELHDFSWHGLLANSFLSDLSISWVHLKSGERLHPHRHPSPSVILVCKGSVCSLGEHKALLQEGDALMIPAGAEHGFVGAGEEGFWGLSIQPREQGIYSAPTAPKVEFTASNNPFWLSALLKANEGYLKAFSQNALFEVFASGTLNQTSRLELFLSHFQVWSDCFQDLLAIRSASHLDSPLHALALEHQKQERGHNNELREARELSQKDGRDPVVAAYCAWFRDQMTSASDVEQAVLMHIVIEASADIFYSRFSSVKTNEPLRHHIGHHMHHDIEHCEMGVRALKEHNRQETKDLARIQEQGWLMLGHLFARFAELMK